MTDKKPKTKDASEHPTDGGNPLENLPILKKQDNDLKMRQERFDRARSLKITSYNEDGKPQESFTVHDGRVEHKDDRPLRVDDAKRLDRGLQAELPEQLSQPSLPQIVAPGLDNPEGERFRAQVQEGLNSIPASVQNYLAKGHWTVHVDQSIEVDEPTLAKKIAAEHKEADGTFAAVFGASDTTQNAIIVSQKALPLNRTEHIYEPDRVNPHPEQTVRHETGHALDNALHAFSQHPEFSKAYEQCCKNLPPGVKEKLAYYLGDPARGKQEVFAELFAAEHGGGPDEQTGIEPLLLKYFGPCLDLIKQQEKSIQHYYGADAKT